MKSKISITAAQIEFSVIGKLYIGPRMDLSYFSTPRGAATSIIYSYGVNESVIELILVTYFFCPNNINETKLFVYIYLLNS